MKLIILVLTVSMLGANYEVVIGALMTKGQFDDFEKEQIITNENHRITDKDFKQGRLSNGFLSFLPPGKIVEIKVNGNSSIEYECDNGIVIWQSIFLYKLSYDYFRSDLIVNKETYIANQLKNIDKFNPYDPNNFTGVIPAQLEIIENDPECFEYWRRYFCEPYEWYQEVMAIQELSYNQLDLLPLDKRRKYLSQRYFKQSISKYDEYKFVENENFKAIVTYKRDPKTRKSYYFEIYNYQAGFKTHFEYVSKKALPSTLNDDAKTFFDSINIEMANIPYESKDYMDVVFQSLLNTGCFAVRVKNLAYNR